MKIVIEKKKSVLGPVEVLAGKHKYTFSSSFSSTENQFLLSGLVLTMTNLALKKKVFWDSWCN